MFFENLFNGKLRKTKHVHNGFLRDISLPTLRGKKSLRRRN